MRGLPYTPPAFVNSLDHAASRLTSPHLRSLGLKNPFRRTVVDEKEEAPVTDSPVVGTVEEKEEVCVVPPEEEQLSDTQKLMKQVKDAGLAGVISYALWEIGFWAVSVPVCVFGYREVTGHWPDFSNAEDMEKLGAEAFAFVNFARFAVPLRIGLALSTTGWIQNNVVDRFMKKESEPICADEPNKQE